GKGWAYPHGSGPYPSRLAAPPVCPRLQGVHGNPSAARCQGCVRPRLCAALLLSSCVARLLLREDTTRHGTSAAVSPPLRSHPCGDEGSGGVPGTKRPHEPCNPSPTRSSGTPSRPIRVL